MSVFDDGMKKLYNDLFKNDSDTSLTFECFISNYNDYLNQLDEYGWIYKNLIKKKYELGFSLRQIKNDLGDEIKNYDIQKSLLKLKKIVNNSNNNKININSKIERLNIHNHTNSKMKKLNIIYIKDLENFDCSTLVENLGYYGTKNLINLLNENKLDIEINGVDYFNKDKISTNIMEIVVDNLPVNCIYCCFKKGKYCNILKLLLSNSQKVDKSCNVDTFISSRHLSCPLKLK